MNTKIYSMINNADAIIIGAGAGLSTAAGIQYGTQDFEKNFPELVQNYGFTDMYTSSFYNFKTEEERWSYWSKHINYLCISKDTTDTYKKLYELFKDKNYFILTTNVDRQFIKAGFDPNKVFEVQGCLTKIQCSKACHNKLYDDIEIIKKMIKENIDIKIPTELINEAYEKFIDDNKDKKILFIELGAGFNTPGIIRYPFESMTYQFDNAYLIRINDKFSNVPNDIEEKAIGINEDINVVIDNINN